MSAHTPGPWDINGFNLTQVIRIQDGPNRQGQTFLDGRHQETIANCGKDHEAPIEERIANARLIAAAPDLLEALEALAGLEVKGHALLDRLQFSESGRALSAQITAAIAKARHGGDHA